MTAYEDHVSRILVVLSPPVKRKALSIFSEKGECNAIEV